MYLAVLLQVALTAPVMLNMYLKNKVFLLPRLADEQYNVGS